MVIQPKNSDELIQFLKSAPLVLYGMGGAGLRIGTWCDEHGIDYVFADRAAKQKQNETAKKVLLPEEISQFGTDVNIVISTIIYYDEICSELLDRGIAKERVFSYKIFMPDDIMWSDLDDNIDWDLMHFRVEMFSKWISEDVRSVVDYGAGKMFLKNYLPADVQYFPVDYIRRNEQTILCDLNAGTFPELQTDAAVCSGVLEFIYTAEQLLEHVCAHTKKMVIISYLGIDNFPDIAGRRASAYVSDLSEQAIIELMNRNGFALEKEVCDPVNHACMVYQFIRKD